VDAVAAHEREQFVLVEDDDAAAGAKDTRRELLVGLGLGWGLLPALGLESAEKTPVLIKSLPGGILIQAQPGEDGRGLLKMGDGLGDIEEML
jgi:hypothetical protein